MGFQRRRSRIIPVALSDIDEIPQRRRFPRREPKPFDIGDMPLDIRTRGLSTQRRKIRRTPFFRAKLQTPLEIEDESISRQKKPEN
jgi:hypothetical protein